jgi:2'-5' RNA ligase
VELARTGSYELEERPWTPHVTVARFRRHGQPFPLQNVNITELRVVRMVLYSSLLKRVGAVHTPIAVFPAS